MAVFKANWRNPSEYPPPGCEDHAWLAWEFIRRHPDYAEHAQQMLRLVEKERYDRRPSRKSHCSLDGVECWPAANKGETAKAYFDRMKQEGIARARVDKPSNTFANRWFMTDPVPAETPYSSGSIRFTPFEVRGKRHEVLATKSFSLFIYPNEMAMRFRLDIEAVVAAWRGEPGAGSYEDVKGFCRSVPLAEIAQHGHVLTPGRYVGAEEVEDDDEAFADKMQKLTEKLGEQMAKGAELDAVIRAKLGGLGYEF